MARLWPWTALYLLGAAAACDTAAESHLFIAEQYETARDCLDPDTTVDVIPTGQAGLTCAPACLVDPTASGGGSERIWVSTMCGPYPAAFDVSGTDPMCAAALAAYARGPDTCTPGGGSSNPTDGGGGGGGDEASVPADDGGVESSTDAAPHADAGRD
jgi:hypothetical protein